MAFRSPGADGSYHRDFDPLGYFEDAFTTTLAAQYASSANHPFNIGFPGLEGPVELRQVLGVNRQLTSAQIAKAAVDLKKGMEKKRNEIPPTPLQRRSLDLRVPPTPWSERNVLNLPSSPHPQPNPSQAMEAAAPQSRRSSIEVVILKRNETTQMPPPSLHATTRSGRRVNIGLAPRKKPKRKGLTKAGGPDVPATPPPVSHSESTVIEDTPTGSIEGESPRIESEIPSISIEDGPIPTTTAESLMSIDSESALVPEINNDVARDEEFSALDRSKWLTGPWAEALEKDAMRAGVDWLFTSSRIRKTTNVDRMPQG